MDQTVDRRPALVVLVGLPGSGKSTARATAAATGASANSYHYSTDDKLDVRATELNMTYSEVFSTYVNEATAESNAELADAIARGQSVVWDQTNMSAKRRRKLMNQFPQEYRRECICILPPMNQEQEAELNRRLANRPGKHIPQHVMRSMRDRFELPSVNEGFTRVLYFDIYGNMVDRNDAADLFGKT